MGVSRNLLPVGYGNKRTYSAHTITPQVSSSLTAGTVNNIAVLQKPPNIIGVRTELLRVTISVAQGQGGGMRYQIFKTTGQATGGTLVPAQPHAIEDPAASSNVRSAPTAGFVLGNAVWGVVNAASNSFQADWRSSDCIPAKPLVIQDREDSGWMIVGTVTSNLTASPSFIVTFEWTEE